MDPIKALTDPERREAATDTLVALGSAAVEPLLAALLNETSADHRHRIQLLLAKRIGLDAYDGVLAALAAAPDEEARGRISRAFTAFGAVDRYVEALSHPSAAVREAAAFGIQNACSVAFGRDPRPGVDYGQVIDALIPLLGDPDQGVAQRAEWALTMLGPGVEEPLRRIRSQGPGHLRPSALSVLAAVGGEEALSPADRAAVERLIRVKLPHDQARPLNTCSASWIAVPGGDRQGIAEILGLFDARPATFKLGLSVGAHDTDDFAEHGRVYVTPQVDGWTLVLGPWCDPVDPERAADLLRLVTELSRRYGRAQAYYFGEHGGGSGWLVAEAGTVVRRFSACWRNHDADFTVGDRLPQEYAACVAEGADVSPDVDDEWDDVAPYLAPSLAAQLGVSPCDLGPHTTVCGTGVVAFTPYARTHGKPRTGAYAI